MKVTLEHLTKQFPSRSKKGEVVTAVNDFSFEIPDGKLVGLLGPSGCGKSTMLNMISGLEKPTSGRIYFGDEDVTDLPPEHRGIGLVFQSYALYPHLTVLENILFPLQNLKGDAKLSKEVMLEKAHEVARLVQIEEYLERKPKELSGGQQQRVAIARALVKMPKVLLLDEPLSNLDARLRLQTREEIRRIQQETGITTIFVTHDQEEAMSITDLMVVMEKGNLRQIDAPQKIYDNPRSLFVAKFLGNPAINVLDGEIKDGGIYIGEDRIGELDGSAAAKKVTVGIRPEAFTVAETASGSPNENILRCSLEKLEVLGRDVNIICKHPSQPETRIKAVLRSDRMVEDSIRTDITFSLNPKKIFIFDPETGERL